MNEPTQIMSDRDYIQTMIDPARSSPASETVVTALVNLEKANKKTTEPISYDQLLGKWRLWWITGTKKTRQRSGVILGSGRYLPQWLKITLSYSKNSDFTLTDAEAGNVENSVSFAGINLTLTGPTKFFPKQKILAFDFTELTIKCFGKIIYSGNIRKGKASRETFYQEPIKKQAFFRYFLMEEDCIAARGRGGGLALWKRLEP